ncbi:ATP-binding protein [Nocardiopsis sp. FR26]|uniref:ATP-binding protein n=1 Tax=Nocardiopsis sp. FR26 TaxID=2605987 RepID=UPI001356A3C4|nr:ATP-binding protein [Nocardiopsis sp. FR26]
MQCIEPADSPAIGSPPVLGDDLPEQPVILIDTGFPGIPASVPRARNLLERSLRLRWIPEETRGNASLVASELATNAVRHTASGKAGGSFALRALLHQARHSRSILTLEVHDQGAATLPRLRLTAPTLESGRGLPLVEAFSDTWGLLDNHQGVYARWAWDTPQNLPVWAEGWEVATDPATNRVRAHHPSEAITFMGATLEELRRLIVDVSQVARLRTEFPGWALNYDKRSNGASQWYTARRKVPLSQRSHSQVNELYAHSAARLRALLQAQAAADRRAAHAGARGERRAR